jgi:hypothetical protein
MKILALAILAALLVPALAADSRDGSNGVPFLAPDPSLKTSDAFLAAMGGQYIGQVAPAYQLPPIFGGPAPVANQTAPEWMNLTAHNEKLNATNQTIVAASSFDLTEHQMRFVPLGQESWL